MENINVLLTLDDIEDLLSALSRADDEGCVPENTYIRLTDILNDAARSITNG
jgi:hypothetical protein